MNSYNLTMIVHSLTYSWLKADHAGRVTGAVVHVFISDSAKDGVFIENMLEH